MRTLGDIMSTSGDVQYIGVDIISTLGDVQYIGVDIMSTWGMFSTSGFSTEIERILSTCSPSLLPRCTEHPLMTHDIPRCTHGVPQCTEHHLM